jgi:DNA modification methylase
VRYQPNRYAETSQTTLTNNTFNIHIGDNQLILPTLPDNSVDSIVTDPPYELGFMGKSWDATGIAYNVDLWRECLRVLKPGGHLLAFSGSRTYHRMAVAIEDAGFQIRDQIMWVYGSGFPKSLNISKAIDKAAGAEREVIGSKIGQPGYHLQGHSSTTGAFNHGLGSSTPETRLASSLVTAPATPEAEVWDGWGTALKPAHEPIVLARKPLDGTVANNVLVHGVGGINIDGCRVGEGTGETKTVNYPDIRGNNYNNAEGTVEYQVTSQGRFPANFIHDGSDEVLELFPDTKGGTWNTTKGARHFNNDGEPTGYATSKQDSSNGSAARFFYCAKANKKDRNEGLDESFEPIKSDTRDAVGAGIWEKMNAPHQNHHPTVKPTDLMRYLCRLITPPNGTVLDPFTGSGSTGKAALLEGFNFIGIEQSEEYAAIAQARIEHVATNE